LFKKIYRYAKGLDKRIKFIFVGGLNTVISYCVNLAVLLLIFGIPFNAVSKATSVEALVAAICGHAAGMANSFLWNKHFTFASSEKSCRQVLWFLAVSLSQLGLQYGLLMLMQNALGTGIYIAQAITLVITTVYGYLGHNYITFKQKDKAGPDAD
jgi:putative flippase GtrA